MLKAENRLKGQAEFSRILKQGQRHRGHFLLLAAAAREQKSPRIGIMISKKVAKKAVERNRIRRIIAHLFGHVFKENDRFDIVVSVFRLPEKTIFSTLEQDIQEWQKKLPSS